jgi:hypothetical protein
MVESINSPRKHNAGRFSGAVEALVVVFLYAAAVPWVLRPWFLASDLLPAWEGPYATMTHADLFLNIWILGWVAHAALVDPAMIFAGNIFHPAPGAILGSENMLAHVPWTAPVLALGGSALLMFKTYLLESFALSGLGMFLYVRYHTKNLAAAFFAGAAYTFTVFRTDTLAQPQYLGTAFLPLALLSIDLWLASGRWRWAAALGLSLAAQAYACVYIGFFTLILTPIYALTRLLEIGRPRWRDILGLSVGGGVALLLLLPLAIPYLEARALGVIPVVDPAIVRVGSWTLSRYATMAFLQWVGFLPFALAVYGLLLRLAPASDTIGRFRAPLPFRALAVFVVVGLWLGLGPVIGLPGGWEIPGLYGAFELVIPGFSSMRVPIRFATVVAAGLSALAGFAVAEIFQTWRPSRQLIAGMGLAVFCVIGAAREPRATMVAGMGPETGAAYRLLAAQPDDRALLELPGPTRLIGDLGANLRNSRYMMNSTRHWRPLLNGYTAYPPPAAAAFYPAILDLPDPAALQRLVDLTGVGWILLHRSELSPKEAPRWAGPIPRELVLVGAFASDELYRIDLRPQQDWQQRLAQMPVRENQTFRGVAIQPLGDHCAAPSLEILEAPNRLSRLPVGVRMSVLVRNQSTCDFPGLAALANHLVGITYRWRPRDGVWQEAEPMSRLPDDLPAGESLRVPLAVSPPAAVVGVWELEVQLVQEGRLQPLATAHRLFEIGPASGTR